MSILARVYQYYLYNTDNEIVLRTNSWTEAVEYKNSNEGISLNTYRR